MKWRCQGGDEIVWRHGMKNVRIRRKTYIARSCDIDLWRGCSVVVSVVSSYTVGVN